MSKLGSDNTPRLVAASGWQVEASPPNADSSHPSTVRLLVAPTSGGRSTLTGAGMAAILNEFNSYWASGKAAKVLARAGSTSTPGCQLTRSGGWVDVLPEDGPGEITTLTGLLATAGNIT